MGVGERERNPGKHNLVKLRGKITMTVARRWLDDVKEWIRLA